MRTQEEIRNEISALISAIIEGEDETSWADEDVAPHVVNKNPLAAAIMALEWALGEERW